jgi:hypothetical protein
LNDVLRWFWKGTILDLHLYFGGARVSPPSLHPCNFTQALTLTAGTIKLAFKTLFQVIVSKSPEHLPRLGLDLLCADYQ